MISVQSYFEDDVKSLGYKAHFGKSTVGVMSPGEYEFNTSSKETMKVIEGELIVLLPGEDTWQTISVDHSFDIPENSSFKVKSIGFTSYLCKYH